MWLQTCSRQARPYTGEWTETDASNWVACLAGAELKAVYLGRIADAGFADVEVVSETRLEAGDGWRSSVRSMNIKATKPARAPAVQTHAGAPLQLAARGASQRESASAGRSLDGV